jgi:hypothetical protein
MAVCMFERPAAINAGIMYSEIRPLEEVED